MVSRHRSPCFGRSRLPYELACKTYPGYTFYPPTKKDIYLPVEIGTNREARHRLVSGERPLDLRRKMPIPWIMPTHSGASVDSEKLRQAQFS